MSGMLGEAWYVVEAYPRCDERAARRLGQLDIAAFVAMREVYRADRRARSRRPIHRKGEPRAVRLEPRFAPYVFVHGLLTDSFRRDIETAVSAGGEPLVRGFVCYAGTREPAEIPGSMVALYAAMRRVADDGGPMVAPGDEVEMVEGPMEGFGALVASVTPSGAVWVEIEMMGRRTPLLAEPWMLRVRQAALRRSA